MTRVSDTDDRDNFPVTRSLLDAIRETGRVVRGLQDWLLYLNPIDLNYIRREAPSGLCEEPWVGISRLWSFDFVECEDVQRGFLRLARIPGTPKEIRLETRFLMPEDRSQPQSEDQDAPSSEAQQPPT